MEKDSLDVMVGYVTSEFDEPTVAQFDLEPARTRDEIAAEYGLVLTQFLAS